MNGFRPWKLLPLLVVAVPAEAQRPPNTVFLEALTVVEIRDLVAAGHTTALVATAGTEQKGPHMVMGEHRFVLEYTTDKIARALGNALVAPIITYVPEGNLDPPSGHMRFPGTITVSQEVFQTLLEETARSLEAGGFRDIVFLGDSGGNQDGMQAVAGRLNGEWQGTGARAHFIGDYYEKTGEDTRRYITGELGIAEEEIGGHAGIVDTSELMFVNPLHIRRERLAREGGFENSGVSGNPTLASPEIGERIVRFKIDNALAQIRASLAGR